jgi:chromosome partitioning protein
MVFWQKQGKTQSGVKIVGGVTEGTIMPTVDAQNDCQFVFIDLEGTQSVTVSRSIAISDFVIIPVQASPEDVRAAAAAIRTVVDEESIIRRSNPNKHIPYKVLLTRTNAPGAPVSGIQKQLEEELREANLPIFKTQIAERKAYKAIFLEGMTLSELKTHGLKVGNLETAQQNVADVSQELISYLEQAMPVEEVTK